MTAAEGLRRAADIIEERGWTRHQPVRNGRVCANQALLLATVGDFGAEYEARRALARQLERTHPLPSSFASVHISRWNDAQPSRRRVTAKFREVADSLEVAS